MCIPLSVTLKNIIRDFEDVTNLIVVASVKWQLLVHVVMSQSVVALMLMTYAGGWSTRGKPSVLPITVLERTYRSTLLPRGGAAGPAGPALAGPLFQPT